MKAKRTKLEPGARYNDWQFVRDDGKTATNSTYAMAVFRCLVCDREFERGIYYVVSGKTKSCKDCSKRHLRKPNQLKSVQNRAKAGRNTLTEADRKELHELYKQYYSKPSYRATVMLTQARRAAAKKGLPCTLTKEWIQDRLENGVCEVSGVPFDFGETSLKHRNKYGPSLDRQSSNLGYTVENTRMVVWIFNLWKSTYTDDEVYEFARKLLK